MKRIFMFITATVVFTTILLFGQGLSANAAGSPKYMIGEVTLVDERMFILKEDATHATYELTASPAKLRALNTGYRVGVTATDGKVLSLTILGMPMQAESELYQKWKVIKNPEEQCVIGAL